MDSDIITQLNLQTAKDSDILIRQVKRTTQQPNYYRIGNGTMNKHGIESIDLIKELVALTKPAQTTLMWIKEGMVWNKWDEQIDFIIKVIPETNAGKQVLKKGFKELSERDLVRRVKRSHYMINPNALITDYAKQLAVWDTLPKLNQD